MTRAEKTHSKAKVEGGNTKMKQIAENETKIEMIEVI
jgi:hypothetical protein